MSKNYNSGAGSWWGIVVIGIAVVLFGAMILGPRTTQETITTTEAIPYQTEYVEDDTLEYGKTVTRTPGVAGARERTYKVTKSGGKETKRELVSTRVTKAPVNAVVAKGTKPGWHCWDTTSFDRNPYNDNYCEYSDGSGKYVPDSKARELDPSYTPGKSGAAYYNSF